MFERMRFKHFHPKYGQFDKCGMGPYYYPGPHGGRHGGFGRGNGSGRGHGRGGFNNDEFNGAQTFRRGKIINFVDRLFTKRNTLKTQLEQEEYKSIHQVISGELKAIDMVINELVQEFDLQEIDSLFANNDENTNDND